MKGLSFLFLTILLLPTASCTHIEQEDALIIDNNVKQVIFFSDETQYQLEAAYYDALIDLKEMFPEAMNEMKTLSPSTAGPYYKQFNVEACPTIIVLYNNTIIAKVEGEKDLGSIVEAVSKGLTEQSSRGKII